MSKLNVARLFDAYQSAGGPHGPTREASSRRRDTLAEKLWRISAAEESPSSALLGADDLASVVRRTFVAGHDRVLWTAAKNAVGTLPVQLRFDELHRRAIRAPPDAERDETAAPQGPAEAAEALTQALGWALARDALGDDYWIVVVLDSAQSGTAPTPRLLEELARLRRVLVVCCDWRETDDAACCDDDGDRANGTARAIRPASTSLLFDLISSEPGFCYLGPVGGLEADGLSAVIEALKAIDRAAVLHLRLMPDVPPAAAGTNGRAPARPSTSAPSELMGPTPAATATGAGVALVAAAVPATVESRRLSEVVEAWVRAYGAFGKRGLYLWKWARCGVDLTTLPCVEPEWRSDVCDTKVLSIMLCVLLDDVADLHGKERLLEALLRIAGDTPSPEGDDLPEEDRHYLDFTRALAEEYKTRTQQYPRYADYLELLHFDQVQFLNALRYSHMLNRRPVLLNMAEHDLYLPHNMHMMSFAMLDLMCSPGFDDRELGKLREATWHAQCMGRIGNLLATWPRELRQRDFTSGVFARAVAEGDLTVDQLHTAEASEIEAAVCFGRHERHFLDRWEQHRRCFAAAAGQIRSVALGRLIEAHERFLWMHLESRGLI
ncbi:MAG TPA: hypothetical protein VGX78_16795 [Pirellulales bacterium]|nr:hypothetical protein [Pirellulales bacterium]